MAFKRRFKKRGGRGKRRKAIKRVTPLQIARGITGKRNYLLERRDGGIVGTRNVITYTVPQPTAGTNSQPDLDNILTATGLTVLGDDNDANGINYWVGNQLIKYNVRNVEHEAAIVTVYVFKNLTDVTEEDLTADIATLGAKLMADLVQGWDVFSTSTMVNLIGTGDAVVYTQADTSCQVESDAIYPSSSVDFNKKWKMLKRSTKKLMPGDDWEFTVKIPNINYDPFKFEQLTTQQAVSGYSDVAPLIAYAGKGRVVLFRTRGVMGKSDADHTIYGYMSTNMSVAIQQKAQVLPLKSQGHSLSFGLVADADAADLRSPSEFVMVTDDGDD